MNVARIMSSPVHTAAPETPLATVVRTMAEHRISAVPITDDGRTLLGVVHIEDLVPQTRNAPLSNTSLMELLDDYVDPWSLCDAYADMANRQAKEAMQDPVVTVRPETTVGIAAKLMAEYDVCAVPVVRDDGVLVGILTRTDLARIALEENRK